MKNARAEKLKKILILLKNFFVYINTIWILYIPSCITLNDICDKTLFLFCNRVKDAKKLVDNTFLLRLHIFFHAKIRYPSFINFTKDQLTRLSEIFSFNIFFLYMLDVCKMYHQPFYINGLINYFLCP